MGLLSSAVKCCWCFFVPLTCLALFPLLGSGLETATRPPRPLHDSLFDSTFADWPLKFFRKFFDEDALLSLSAVYWFSGGVVWSFGLCFGCNWTSFCKALQISLHCHLKNLDSPMIIIKKAIICWEYYISSSLSSNLLAYLRCDVNNVNSNVWSFVC